MDIGCSWGRQGGCVECYGKTFGFSMHIHANAVGLREVIRWCRFVGIAHLIWIHKPYRHTLEVGLEVFGCWFTVVVDHARLGD